MRELSEKCREDVIQDNQFSVVHLSLRGLNANFDNLVELLKIVHTPVMSFVSAKLGFPIMILKITCSIIFQIIF